MPTRVLRRGRAYAQGVEFEARRHRCEQAGALKTIVLITGNPNMSKLRGHSLILLAGVASVIAGCTSTPGNEAAATAVASYQSKIREIVTDPARAATLTTLVDQADAQRRAAEAEAEAFAADFQRLNADYDATKDQFTALMTKHRGQRRQFAEALLALRDKMVAGTTPQEWEALSKVREKGLDTIFKAELPDDSTSTLTAMIGGHPC